MDLDFNPFMTCHTIQCSERFEAATYTMHVVMRTHFSKICFLVIDSGSETNNSITVGITAHLTNIFSPYEKILTRWKDLIFLLLHDEGHCNFIIRKLCFSTKKTHGKLLLLQVYSQFVKRCFF